MRPSPASSKRMFGLLKARRQTDLKHAMCPSKLGRTHVYKPKPLPPAQPPLFPQQVVLADGSSFTHYTTSPRSVYKLTKDLSNHPLWYPNKVSSRDLQDEFGRIGRFKSKYATTGSENSEDDPFASGIEDWMSEGAVELKQKPKVVVEPKAPVGKKGKR
ncbi:hypothetical protein [Phaffia rhodozyma]|uniref:Uncharacterized protein n=1 Tax=Phaffia rhodozyma TaxID=264483 RepID=A0A0F7SQ99_PHARH|nr:hypothetical protein [Phaffia rhodozyma]